MRYQIWGRFNEDLVSYEKVDADSLQEAIEVALTQMEGLEIDNLLVQNDLGTVVVTFEGDNQIIKEV